MLSQYSPSFQRVRWQRTFARVLCYGPSQWSFAFFCRKDDVAFWAPISAKEAPRLRGLFGGDGGIRLPASLCSHAALLERSSSRFQLQIIHRMICLTLKLSRVRIPRYFPTNESEGTRFGYPLIYGGDGGIRTPETMVWFTRFPVARPRPARRHLHAAAQMLPRKRHLAYAQELY